METTPGVLSPFSATLWVLLGIFISLLLPVAVKTLQSARPSPGSATRGNLWALVVAAWQQYGGPKYLGIFLAAVLVAIVLVFLLGLQFSSAREAALAGFAWESLINKLFS
ncbi:MAG: hypothetical protein FJZ90_16045 [Chloroflexi bacterium]|nr:hypothetical protein [Chloroflexota bacterium]